MDFINNPSLRNKADCILSKGFLGGMAMAAPFYAEFFSWRWAGLLVVPFLLLALIFRERVKGPHWAVLPMIALLLLHAVALGLSDTIFASQVIKDLVLACFLLVIYFLADKDTSVGFFYSILPLALVTSVLGLIKAGLMERGYLVGVLIESCSFNPPGSTLCVNYNNLGFIWLVGILGCLNKRFWWLLPLLIAAGALSGSRRFVVLMVFIPVVWVLLEGRSAVAKSVFTVLFSTVLIYGVTDPVSFDRYRSGEEPFRVLEFKFDAEDGVESDHFTVKINRSAPMVMLGTMADGTLGMGSRLDFWKLGVSMLGWMPQGWSYHEVFSCSFSPCSEFHYPHMSIMTEWIIGGGIFGFVAIAFYAWPFLLILRAKRVLPIALFVVTLPYSLISGDTVFSLPICIACMLVALSSVRRDAPRTS